MGEREKEGFRIFYFRIWGCSSMRSYCYSLTTREIDFRGVGMSTEHTDSLKFKIW